MIRGSLRLPEVDEGGGLVYLLVRHVGVVTLTGLLLLAGTAVVVLETVHLDRRVGGAGVLEPEGAGGWQAVLYLDPAGAALVEAGQPVRLEVLRGASSQVPGTSERTGFPEVPGSSEGGRDEVPGSSGAGLFSEVPGSSGSLVLSGSVASVRLDEVPPTAIVAIESPPEGKPRPGLAVQGRILTGEEKVRQRLVRTFLSGRAGG